RRSPRLFRFLRATPSRRDNARPRLQKKSRPSRSPRLSLTTRFPTDKAAQSAGHMGPSPRAPPKVGLDSKVAKAISAAASLITWTSCGVKYRTTGSSMKSIPASPMPVEFTFISRSIVRGSRPTSAWSSRAEFPRSISPRCALCNASTHLGHCPLATPEITSPWSSGSTIADEGGQRLTLALFKHLPLGYSGLKNETTSSSPPRALLRYRRLRRSPSRLDSYRYRPRHRKDSPRGTRLQARGQRSGIQKAGYHFQHNSLERPASRRNLRHGVVELLPAVGPRHAAGREARRMGSPAAQCQHARLRQRWRAGWIAGGAGLAIRRKECSIASGAGQAVPRAGHRRQCPSHRPPLR